MSRPDQPLCAVEDLGASGFICYLDFGKREVGPEALGSLELGVRLIVTPEQVIVTKCAEKHRVNLLCAAFALYTIAVGRGDLSIGSSM